MSKNLLNWRRLKLPAIYLSLVLLVAQGILAAATNIFAGQMAVAPNTHTLIWLAICLVGWAIGFCASRIIWNIAVTKAEGRLRADLLAAAFAQPVAVLANQPAGEILDRIDDDTSAIGRFTRDVLFMVLAFACGLVPLWIVAATTWWPSWILMPALGVAVYFASRSRLALVASRKVSEEAAWTAHAAAFEEAVSARDDLRTSLGQPFAVRRLAELSATIHQRLVALTKVESQAVLIGGLLLQGTLAAIVITAVFLSARGRLPVASLVTLFLATVAITGQLGGLMHQLPQIQEGVGAITRIRQLLSVQPEPVGGAAVPTGPIGIDIVQLNFAYPGADNLPGDAGSQSLSEDAGPLSLSEDAGPLSLSEDAGSRSLPNDAMHPGFALHDVSLRIPPGQTLALIGRTGSGKSTLASMLSRAVDPPSGTIFFNGVDVTELNLTELRQSIGVVTQRTEILAGTLRQNIALFADVAPEAVEHAIAELDLTDWVAGLDAGLDTPLGPGGVNLSAGEEQLIAFARLLVRDVSIVVLDEATARMDPLTEALVVAASSRLLAGRTGVLVAHRLSTIERADLVAVVEQGRLAQYGSRAQLAQTDGPYRDLINAADAPKPRLEATPSAGSPIGTVRKHGDRPQRRDPRAGDSLMRAVWRQFTNHKRWGLLGALAYTIVGLTSANGVIGGYLWGQLVGALESGTAINWLLAGFAISVLAEPLFLAGAQRIYPLWWIQQSLRVRMAVMRAQIATRRLPHTPPGEVVARAMDSDRIITYADNWIDVVSYLAAAVLMVGLARSWIAGAVLVGVMALSATAAVAGRPIAGRAAKAAADERAVFGRTLVSVVDGIRTVKLSAREADIETFLMAVDARRVKAVIREQTVSGVLNSVPMLVVNLAVLASWWLFYAGTWSLATALLVGSAAMGFQYGGIVAGLVITGYPGARAWQVATSALADGADLFSLPDGVSTVSGTAPSPVVPAHTPLEVLELRDVSVRHDEDGTVGVAGINLVVRPGELVLLLGQIGSGKSSLLAALAGLMWHDGDLLWNGVKVRDPEEFLRPGRVAFVSQQPHVISGSYAENLTLDYPNREVTQPITIARLEQDVQEAGGVDALIGYRGVKLSGGQAQRLALARALATGSELLVADDISSALDATTEVELWEGLRARGTTVIGSTSKAAALAKADCVVVLVDGEQVATGTWDELAPDWGHLAG